MQVRVSVTTPAGKVLDVKSEKYSVTVDPAAQLIVKSMHPVPALVDSVTVGVAAPPQLVCASASAAAAQFGLHVVH